MRQLSLILLSLCMLQMGIKSTQGSLQEAIQTKLTPEALGQIIPGIHKEILPQPIYYETYIPIILEYETPKWNKSDITFNNWYECTSETIPYRLSCPVTFHMNKMMENLHVDFQGLHPVVDTDTSVTQEARSNFYKQMTTSSDFCSKIQNHFGGIWTNVTDYKAYISALRNCQWGDDRDTYGGKILIQRNISDYNYSLRAPFTKMENNFYNNFYKNISAPDTTTNIVSNLTTTSTSSNNSTQDQQQIQSPSSVSSTSNPKLDLVASAVLSNSRSLLQSTMIGVFYAEKNRWIHATSDCLAQRIPQSVVTRSKLSDALRNISASAAIRLKRIYDLSIDINTLSKYYSLPLTDCTHTKDGRMIVRIQIPAIKRNRAKSLQFVQVHSIPFEYKGHVCKVKLNSGGGGSEHENWDRGFFQNGHGLHYIYDAMTEWAYPTDCKSHELCRISESELKMRSNSDHCVSALISKNVVGVKNHCQFQCHKQDLSENPIVTRINSNQFVITGSSLNLKIECTEAKLPTFSAYTSRYAAIDSDRIGAQLINLPCHCRVAFHKKGIIIYGEGHCEEQNIYHDQKADSDVFHVENFSNLSVTPIMPYHFARMKPTIPVGASNKNAPEAGTEVVESFYIDHLNDDASVNLADFVDIERINSYLKSGGESGGGKIKGVTGGEEISEDEKNIISELDCSGSMISLWIVFILTTIILLTIQGYMFYKMRTFHAFGYRNSESRIVYKVPDSPVMY